MGNSEVGHLNLGAGRPVLQDLPRIDAAIADGSFFDAAGAARGVPSGPRAPGGRLHLISLIGPGGVHANDRHLVALAELAARHGRPARPRPRAARRPRHAAAIGARVRRRPRAAPRRGPPGRPDRVGRRPLLRDGPRQPLGPRRARLRRDRPRGRGARADARPPRSRPATSAARTTSSSPRRSSTASTARVRDGDPIIHANFRADRARQLTHALADARLRRRSTGRRPTAGPAPTDLLVVTMTEYEAGLPVEVAFPPEEARSLAQAFSEAGWRQFHVAETEKYAHVTYFFNGGVEAPYPGEERLLDPEPARSRPTTSSPAMSARRRHRRAGRGDRVAALRLHRRQLRQPGHGRPHGRLGRDDRPPSRSSTAASARIVDGDRRGRRRRPGRARRAAGDHRRPRQRRRAARRRGPCRSPPTRSTRCRSCWSVARPAGSRLADGVLADVAPTLLELAGLPPLGRDDRPVADLVIASVAVAFRGA